jgi:xanthine dehydrogenase YagS FAD-binding subunit
VSDPLSEVIALLQPRGVFTRRVSGAGRWGAAYSAFGHPSFGVGTGRVALGGVAHKPWRVEEAEAELPRGAKAVMSAVLADAMPTSENAFKLQLAERALGAILLEAKE